LHSAAAVTLGLVDTSVESPELLNCSFCGNSSLCLEIEDATDKELSPWSTRDGMSSSQGILVVLLIV
jgi:hypothetical protein